MRNRPWPLEPAQRARTHEAVHHNAQGFRSSEGLGIEVRPIRPDPGMGLRVDRHMAEPRLVL